MPGAHRRAATLPSLIGTASPDFIQAAATAAWNDDDTSPSGEPSSPRTRALPRHAPALGLEVCRSEAGLYLWVKAPGGDDVAYVERLARTAGILVQPGSYLGSAGKGYFRLSLSPTVADCRRAAEAWRRHAHVHRNGRAAADWWKRPRSMAPCSAGRDRRGDRGRHCRARPRRAALRREARVRVGHPRLGEAGHPPLLRAAQDGGHRRRALEFRDKIPLEARPRDARACAWCPPGVVRYGAFLERGRDRHARLRQHRRPRGRGDDGRHLGHGGLLRADRPRRAPRRRRRNRRRARAARRARR